ncbi:MAG: VanW family protein [Candidatus Nanopelagicales bacterium]
MTEPTEDLAQPRPRRTGRRIAIATGGAVVLLVGGYAAAVVAVSGDVPAGTSVRGVDIGGMSGPEAASTLESALGQEAAAPIEVRAGASSAELEPATSGLAVDWMATARQAAGTIWRPSDLLAHLRGDVTLDLITTTDTTALTAALAPIAEESAADPVEPTIRYTKKAVAKLTEGAPGASLDVPAATDVISAAYLQPVAQPLALPMTSVPTAVSAQEADRVFTEFAEPAVALPVTLAVGEGADREKAEVPAVDIAANLAFEVKGTTLAPDLDAKELHKDLGPELEDIQTTGRNADIRIEGGKPVVIPSRAGRAIDPEELGTAVLAVLPETSADARVASVELSRSPAKFTTADAKALNIKEKLSSFRQPFVPAQYRYVNVGEAARRINGTILEPGDTFSMNGTVGERTSANGFTEGFIISGGRFREELGGGVSIITTAMWTAGFYAGLERVEQHPHGLYISRYQAGLEATVAWGYLDLRMRNETGNGVLITATRYSDGVVIEMWGTKKWDEVTASFSPRTNYTNFTTIEDTGQRCVPSSGVRGFDISVTRRRINDGKSEKTETFFTRYKPTPNVVCGS